MKCKSRCDHYGELTETTEYQFTFPSLIYLQDGELEFVKSRETGLRGSWAWTRKFTLIDSAMCTVHIIQIMQCAWYTLHITGLICSHVCRHSVIQLTWDLDDDVKRQFLCKLSYQFYSCQDRNINVKVVISNRRLN